MKIFRTGDNLRFMFLARNERPDFRTINDFRKNNAEELAGTLRRKAKNVIGD